MVIKWPTRVAKILETIWRYQARDSGKEKARTSYPKVDLFVKLGKSSRRAWSKSLITSKNP
jgi:hypothetical protein